MKHKEFQCRRGSFFKVFVSGWKMCFKWSGLWAYVYASSSDTAHGKSPVWICHNLREQIIPSLKGGGEIKGSVSGGGWEQV